MSWPLEPVQPIVEEFRQQLGIREHVDLLIAHDPKLVSVCRRGNGRFLLSIDRDFLTFLDKDELRSAIAHEFGHIWIFTHHPYLQTEALANRTAIKLVPEESLQKTYAKVAEFQSREGHNTQRAENHLDGVAKSDDKSAKPGLSQAPATGVH